MARAMGPFQRTGTIPEWASDCARDLSKMENPFGPDVCWVNESDVYCILAFNAGRLITTLYIIERFPEDESLEGKS